MKTCTKCKKDKKIHKFSNDKRAIDGHTSVCKKCDKVRSMIYKRSMIGLVSRIYNNQKTVSERRGYAQPKYSMVELREWLLLNKTYIHLHDEWVVSNYKYGLSPSVDRRDDYESYTLDNIQVMTWDENNLKGNVDQINGKLNKRNVSVSQFTLDGVFVKTYHSLAEASRVTCISKVSDCVSNPTRNKSAGGYIWRYCNGK